MESNFKDVHGSVPRKERYLGKQKVTEDCSNIWRNAKINKLWKKGVLDLQKDKRTAGYSYPNVYFELFRPNGFL